jgi:phosphopantetheinyl transferase
MAERERDLVGQSELGQREAAVRVWSAKEAVAKAAGLELTDAWQRVRILTIGGSESRISIDGKESFITAHATVDNHVFTLFKV